MNLLFLETLGYESALRISGHHYARAAVRRGHRVLSVSAPVTPLHRLAREGRESIAARFENHRRGFVEAPGGALHYVPSAWLPVRRAPVLDSALAVRLSALAWRGDLLRRMRALDFRPDALLVQNALFWPLVRDFPRAATVHRVVDRMAAFDDFPRCLLALERRAIRECDLVTVTSASLLDVVPEELRAKTLVTNNGVDLAHFAAPRPRPAILADVPDPFFAYVGALRSWFDWELLAELARRIPEATFALVSPDRPPPGRVAGDGGPPNVRHPGPAPYETIPAILQHAAAGVIPFLDNALVRSVSPLKLFECLASGRPVVSLDWPELRAMAPPPELVRLARTPDEFEAGLRAAIEARRRAGEAARAETGGGSEEAEGRERFARVAAEFLRDYDWDANLTRMLERLGGTGGES